MGENREETKSFKLIYYFDFPNPSVLAIFVWIVMMTYFLIDLFPFL